MPSTDQMWLHCKCYRFVIILGSGKLRIVREDYLKENQESTSLVCIIFLYYLIGKRTVIKSKISFVYNSPKLMRLLKNSIYNTLFIFLSI